MSRRQRPSGAIRFACRHIVVSRSDFGKATGILRNSPRATDGGDKHFNCLWTLSVGKRWWAIEDVAEMLIYSQPEHIRHLQRLTSNGTSCLSQGD
jgi:hypothetical protein